MHCARALRWLTLDPVREALCAMAGRPHVKSARRALLVPHPPPPPPPKDATAQMLVPLAGGGQEMLLSEVGLVMLPFFTTRDACALRLSK